MQLSSTEATLPVAAGRPEPGCSSLLAACTRGCSAQPPREQWAQPGLPEPVLPALAPAGICPAQPAPCSPSCSLLPGDRGDVGLKTRA